MQTHSKLTRSSESVTVRQRGNRQRRNRDCPGTGAPGGGALERLDVSFNRLTPVVQALCAVGDVVNCDIDIGDNYPRSDVVDDDVDDDDDDEEYQLDS